MERRWTLIAESGDGPEIPVLAATILAERIVSGDAAPGARDAGGALNLGDFAPSFAGLAIRHEIRDIAQRDALYARVMGARFARLAPAVAGLHGVLRDGGRCGRARVTRGGGPFARLVAAVLRFPPAGDHALHVAFSERDGVETWTRDFSGRRFASRLFQHGDQLVEAFGPLRFRFDLHSEGDGLRMVMRGWSFLSLPLPSALAPRADARERHEGDDFLFDVSIALPLVGLIVRYRGRLEPG